MGTIQVAPGRPAERGQVLGLSTPPSTSERRADVATARVGGVLGQTVHVSTSVHTEAPTLAHPRVHTALVWGSLAERGDASGLTRGAREAVAAASTRVNRKGVVVHTVLHGVDRLF